jgi:flagellar motor switch protein FliM
MSSIGQQHALRQESLDQLLADAASSIDRLPMLRVVFERVAGIGSESLAAISGREHEIEIEQLGAGLAAKVLEPYLTSSISAIVAAPQWGANVILVADRSCVDALVESLLGGDGSEPAYVVERPFSNIELRVCQLLFQSMCAALGGGFSELGDVSFGAGHASSEIDLSALGRGGQSVVVATLRVMCGERGGQLLVVIPQAVLNPLRQALARVPDEEAKAHDPHWSQQLQNEITRTRVMLSAILDERLVPLSQLATLAVGQVLPLRATPHTRLRVEGNGEALLWCQFGKSNGTYVLRVDGFIDREQEFIDDVLSG